MKIVKVAWMVPLLGLSGEGMSQECTEPPTTRVVQRFQAVGFGTSNQPWATVGQNQLMAIRTAKLDAYRTLAEQVYGFRISGSTTISAMMVKNDRMRIHVDALVRGAQVVSVQPIGKEVYEVTLEMEMLVSDQYQSC